MRIPKLRPKRRRKAVPHGPKAAGSQQALSARQLKELGCPELILPYIRDDDRIGKELIDLLNDRKRCHPAITVLSRRQRPFPLPDPDPLPPPGKIKGTVPDISPGGAALARAYGV